MPDQPPSSDQSKVAVANAIGDRANEEAVKDWNQCISPRLASLHSWFSADDWHKSLKPYLQSVLSRRREHLEKQANDAHADQFIKGQIAMLKEIMEIPAVINRQIVFAESNKNIPKGDAGY